MLRVYVDHCNTQRPHRGLGLGTPDPDKLTARSTVGEIRRRRAVIGVGGCRHWDGRQEAEADCLGSALLVPRAGALAWMLESDDIDAGANNFGVSVALFRWRLNHTGVVRHVEKLRREARLAR